MIDLRTWLGRRLAPPSTLPRCSSVGLRTASASRLWPARVPQRANERRSRDLAPSRQWRMASGTGYGVRRVSLSRSPATRLLVSTTPASLRRSAAGVMSPFGPPPHLPELPRLLPRSRGVTRPAPGTSEGLGGVKTGSPTLQHPLDNCRRDGDPRLAASRLPRATAVSPPVGRLGLLSGDPRGGRRDGSRTRAGGAIRTAPNPGTWREARSEETEVGGKLGRRGNGTGAMAKAAEVREGTPIAEGECCRRPRTRAEQREGR